MDEPELFSKAKKLYEKFVEHAIMNDEEIDFFLQANNDKNTEDTKDYDEPYNAYKFVIQKHVEKSLLDFVKGFTKAK